MLAYRAGHFSDAANDFRQASQRVPESLEDRAFLIQALQKAGQSAEAAQERDSSDEALGPNALPAIHADANGAIPVRYDRIKSELETTVYRLEITGMRPTTASSSTAASSSATAMDTPGSHIRRGRLELSSGNLDAAESDFRAALKVEPSNATAHRELGDLYWRRGKLNDAVTELKASLAARDSAVVHITLARVYLDQKRADLARVEVERALKLAPNYAEAKQLQQHLNGAKPGGPGGQ